jgi:hypothetical protein
MAFNRMNLYHDVNCGNDNTIDTEVHLPRFLLKEG